MAYLLFLVCQSMIQITQVIKIDGSLNYAQYHYGDGIFGWILLTE